MQQAIYINTPVARPSAISAHGTGICLETNAADSEMQRFGKSRLVISVLGNVVGGAALLSGMLLLPQLLLSLLAG